MYKVIKVFCINWLDFIYIYIKGGHVINKNIKRMLHNSHVLGCHENIYEEGSVIWVEINEVGIWEQTRTSLNKLMRNLLRDKNIVFDKMEHNHIVLSKYIDGELSSQYIIVVR